MICLTKAEKKKERGARQSFLQGALILTAGMAVVKVIGALFKIPLKYAIGEYGMGLFNVAYNFYGPIFSLATAGFPIAIARMVSEDSTLGRWNDVRQVKRVSLPAFLLAGLLGMVLITLAAPYYCEKIVGNQNALLPMLALAPAILFACVGAVFRGHYEGLRNMIPTAVSEIVEAVAKLLIGLSAACAVVSACTEEYAANGTVFAVHPASPDEAVFLTLAFAAAAAVLGVTCGSIFSLFYLALRYRFRGDGITARMYREAPPARGKRETMKKLVATTLPIAVGSIAMNVAGLIDATFLQNRIGHIMETAPQALLACYKGQIPEIYLDSPSSVSTFLYGCYTLALTIYLLVPAITQAFGVSALPSVTEAWTRGNKKEIKSSMESVIRVTALFCFPAGLGISALAEPIVQVLYGKGQSSSIIAGALFLLGLASLAAALSTPLSSMLQAVGRMDLPVKLLFAAMGIKIAVNFWLCGIPEINIAGAGVGTLCCYLFLVVSQLWCLQKVTGVKISAGLLLRPLASAGVCACGAYFIYEFFSRQFVLNSFGEAAALAAGIAVGAVVYVISLGLLHAVDRNDVLMLPKGQKIAKMLEKRGWI